MLFGSCLFLFHQFTQRDKTDQVIADMDALPAFSVAFIRGPDIDCLDQLMGCIGRQFGQLCVLPGLLNELFKILVLFQVRNQTSPEAMAGKQGLCFEETSAIAVGDVLEGLGRSQQAA